MFQEPVASNEGLGGTYFFSSEAGACVGIMKPVDEEPLAPNNPKVCWPGWLPGLCISAMPAARPCCIVPRGWLSFAVYLHLFSKL